MRQAVKDVVKKVVPVVNRYSERVGVRLQPVHYYSEVPDRTWLRAHQGSWARPIDLTGVRWDLEEETIWLEKVCAPHVDEVAGLAAWAGYGVDDGPGYGPIESQVLHAVVRATAPARVVEVGSGVSTALLREAAVRNEDEGRPGTAITCIEPFPHEGLRRLPGVTLVEELAQDVDAAVFDQLAAGDILFIDSTHAVRTGSELARLYLEVLPRLAPGVLVHVHDVYLPFLFAPDVLDAIFDWQETTLLAALLTNNGGLEVLACLSALHHDRPDMLARLFPDYCPRPMHDGLDADPAASARGSFPSSLWLVTT